MNHLFRIRMLAALALGIAAIIAVGCKSTPSLTTNHALALIQAQLNQQPPESALIEVNDDGMKVGVTAKYWDRSRAYPNRVWADFKLTDTGKKTLRLVNGGDTIEWHPDSATDTRYKITVTPVIASHLKAANAGQPQDGIGNTKSLVFDEITPLDGVPEPVQEMARASQTDVATHHTATFVLENGDWKLQSIN